MTDKLNLDSAAHRLSELGHPTRLRIIRELIRYGDDGVPVKHLQEILDIPGSTLSHHIRQLKSAELVMQCRSGTTLYCVAMMENISGLVAFLTEECCQRAPTQAAANDA